MAQPLLDVVSPGNGPGGGDAWLPLDECRDRVPPALVPWLEEPGLLTARVRATCGAATRLRLLRLEHARMDPDIARRLSVEDDACLLREIEFTCGARRWIFAQTVLPQSSVKHHPWLRELGDNGLGVAGVNWSTSIIALKAFNAQGSTTSTSIVQALQWAVDYPDRLASAIPIADPDIPGDLRGEAG